MLYQMFKLNCFSVLKGFKSCSYMDNYCLQYVDKWKWGCNKHCRIENIAQKHDFKCQTLQLSSAICQSVQGQLTHFITQVINLSIGHLILPKMEVYNLYDFQTFPLCSVNQVHHLGSMGERFGWIIIIVVVIINIIKGYPRPSKQEDSTSLQTFSNF